MASAYPSGLGNDQQAMQATAAMRQEPWYRQMVSSWGLDPRGDANGNVRLSDDQRAQLMATAIQHGIGFNNKFDMIDENGQIAEEHHKLKKIAIASAIAGLAVTGLSAAGIGPLSGALGGASAATAGGGAAATAGGTGAAAAGGGIAGAIGTGAKLASLIGAGKGLVDSFGSQQASEANQLANNRLTDARVAQGGPAADAQSFRNAMRSGLVAKMDPNAAPLSLNGHALPSLANADTTSYAGAQFAGLRDRLNAGKAPTLFGVPGASQAEQDAGSRASKLGTAGTVLDTGSKIANLFGLLKKGAPGVATAADIPYDYAGMDKVQW